MMAENISHPVVHGRSVTVQRHRHSGNLKVSPTNLRTHGEGSRDACAPNKVLWQRCNCGCFTFWHWAQIKQWHKIRKESILMERGFELQRKSVVCHNLPIREMRGGQPTNRGKPNVDFTSKGKVTKTKVHPDDLCYTYLDFCVEFTLWNSQPRW